VKVSQMHVHIHICVNTMKGYSQPKRQIDYVYDWMKRGDLLDCARCELCHVYVQMMDAWVGRVSGGGGRRKGGRTTAGVRAGPVLGYIRLISGVTSNTHTHRHKL
jgi:hypothetical protein